jgi:hypothetical protein
MSLSPLMCAVIKKCADADIKKCADIIKVGMLVKFDYSSVSCICISISMLLFKLQFVIQSPD